MPSPLNSPIVDSALRLFWTQAVGGLDVVDRGYGVSVNCDLELSFRECENRMDRHFEVVMFAVLSDQEVVRVDLTHMSKPRAVEGAHRSPDRDVARTVRVVSHRCLLWVGVAVSRLVLLGRDGSQELGQRFRRAAAV